MISFRLKVKKARAARANNSLLLQKPSMRIASERRKWKKLPKIVAAERMFR